MIGFVCLHYAQVLPRQLCNLYTKTYKFEHFATGKEGIQLMAQGGYVFEVIVNNLVSQYYVHTYVMITLSHAHAHTYAYIT